MEIILATHNLDKCKELQESFSDTNIKVYTLKNFPEIDEIIEDGNTLQENALIKARTVFELTGLPAISDDTGLEVDALNGAPGIYTARYAGENCSYLDNVNKMLVEMKEIPDKNRSATFKTVMAYVDSSVELTCEGIVQGTITRRIKGVGGFGYDSIFYSNEKKKTFAEMTIEEKNLVSHRSKAISNLKAELATYLNTPNKKENA